MGGCGAPSSARTGRGMERTVTAIAQGTPKPSSNTHRCQSEAGRTGRRGPPPAQASGVWARLPGRPDSFPPRRGLSGFVPRVPAQTPAEALCPGGAVGTRLGSVGRLSSRTRFQSQPRGGATDRSCPFLPLATSSRLEAKCASPAFNFIKHLQIKMQMINYQRGGELPSLRGRNRTLLASYLGLLELHAVCKEESFLRRKKRKIFCFDYSFLRFRNSGHPCASGKSY